MPLRSFPYVLVAGVALLAAILQLPFWFRCCWSVPEAYVGLALGSTVPATCRSVRAVTIIHQVEREREHNLCHGRDGGRVTYGLVVVGIWLFP